MDYTQLFIQLAVILITLMFGLITRKLLPWLGLKASKEMKDLLFKLVVTGVKAAEQTFSKPKSGPEKKKYVYELLLASSYDFDFSELDALIDSIVYEMNLSKIAVPDSKEVAIEEMNHLSKQLNESQD